MLIKIVTFNMAHGKGMDGVINLEKQAEIINSYKPDIVFLQEIDMYTKRVGEVNQIRELAEDDDRNFSQYINLILKKWIAEHSSNE